MTGFWTVRRRWLGEAVPGKGVDVLKAMFDRSRVSQTDGWCRAIPGAGGDDDDSLRSKSNE